MAPPPDQVAETAHFRYIDIVLANLPSAPWVRLVLIPLLATIGLFAVQPIDGVLSQRGSAFSAATSDVAISASRRIETVRLHVAPVPHPPVEPTMVVASDPILAEQPDKRPDSTGPPALVILARQPPVRGPPLA